jgi:hypothetical protein
MTKELCLNFVAGARDLCVLHSLQTSSGVHFATFSVVMSIYILTLEIDDYYIVLEHRALITQ